MTHSQIILSISLSLDIQLDLPEQGHSSIAIRVYTVILIHFIPLGRAISVHNKSVLSQQVESTLHKHNLHSLTPVPHNLSPLLSIITRLAQQS